ELRAISLLEFVERVLLRVVEADVLERGLECGHVFEALLHVVFGHFLMLLAAVATEAVPAASAHAAHSSHAPAPAAATWIALRSHHTGPAGEHGCRDARECQKIHPSHRSISSSRHLGDA